MVVAVAEEEEEGSPCGFFSVGSATETADCDMQPMEKGKTAKRSPPPELPRRSFMCVVVGRLPRGEGTLAHTNRDTAQAERGRWPLARPASLKLAVLYGMQGADGCPGLCFWLCCQGCMIDSLYSQNRGAKTKIKNKFGKGNVWWERLV